MCMLLSLCDCARWTAGSRYIRWLFFFFWSFRVGGEGTWLDGSFFVVEFWVLKERILDAEEHS